MLRYSFLIALLFVSVLQSAAQELFVYSEPASNMPSKSIGLRLTNRTDYNGLEGKRQYYTAPEVMWGVNNKIMVHALAFLSNSDGNFSLDGTAFYAKYRFLSRDEVYKHFRMAVFGKVSSNKAKIKQTAISISGQNAGCQLGIIGTQLLHKVALSSTFYYEQITAGQPDYFQMRPVPLRAVNYSLSAGKLMLPKAYKSYDQTNFNLMLEVLGQWQPDNGFAYVDIAPSVQMIFNSQTRVDFGYRRAIYVTENRNPGNSVLLRVEHLLFNVL